MKNSLFKRAIAVASAVPVALTQCLTVANAVYVDYSAPAVVKSAESETFTLDKGESTSILYIAPEEDYAREGNVFTKDSQWNGRVSSALAQNAGKKDTLDLTKIYEKAIEKSGEYEEVTRSLIEKIEYVNYTITDDGKIVIDGKLNNITPTFTAGGAKTIGGALRELAAKYGVDDLYEPENFFDEVVIGCTFKAVIDGSSLADGTEVTGTFELTDAASGEVYKGTGAIDWALEGFDKLKDTAKATCDKYSDIIDTTDAYKEIDDSVSFYVDKLETASEKAESVYMTTSSVEAATGTEFAKLLNDKAAEKEMIAELTKDNPFAWAWRNEMGIFNYYAEILEQVNAIADPHSFNIKIVECRTLALSLYDIKSSADKGYATFEAKFPDMEAAAVETYIESTYNVEVVDVYKTIEVIADGTKAAHEFGGEGTADMKIERVVIVEEKTTTTTTTATTTASDDTTTTTTTTEVVPGGSTTTTTEVVPGGSTTTTEVAPGGSTTTTTEVVPGGSTTTTTEVVPGGSTTTTTDSTPGGSTETTTRTETKYVVNYKTETVAGFYLDIDKEFNIEQVKSLGYSVDYATLSYGENGELVGEEILVPGEVVDIIDSIEFKDVPADVAKLLTNDGVNQFAAAIQIYASKDITAADGTVVAKAGDKLTNVNGSPVAAPAYIGVKGDANLDMKCDSSDASVVLSWYANSQTGGDTSRFTTENVVVDEYPILDDFAAFLADVDNENDSANYVTLKNARNIDAKDASYILAYYAKVSTGSPAGRDTWNGELGEFGKY